MYYSHDIPSLEIVSLQLLDKIVKCFADLKDKHAVGHSLLEQYEAPIFTTLSAVLQAEHVLPKMIIHGSTLASSIIGHQLTYDAVQIRR